MVKKDRIGASEATEGEAYVVSRNSSLASDDRDMGVLLVCRKDSPTDERMMGLSFRKLQAKKETCIGRGRDWIVAHGDHLRATIARLDHAH